MENPFPKVGEYFPNPWSVARTITYRVDYACGHYKNTIYGNAVGHLEQMIEDAKGSCPACLVIDGGLATIPRADAVRLKKELLDWSKASNMRTPSTDKVFRLAMPYLPFDKLIELVNHRQKRTAQRATTILEERCQE